MAKHEFDILSLFSLILFANETNDLVIAAEKYLGHKFKIFRASLKACILS